jgi:hypothetical protein
MQASSDPRDPRAVLGLSRRGLATPEPAASQRYGRPLPPLRATRSTFCGPGRRNGPKELRDTRSKR